MEKEDFLPQIPVEIERRKEAESVLDEIYTRLDNARLMGVNLELPRVTSPFRLEDEAYDPNKVILFDKMKIIEKTIRERAFVPKEEEEPFHEFSRKGLRIRVPVEGNEESRRFVGGDIDITVKFGNRKINIKRAGEGEHNNYALNIEYAQEGEYEGLSYNSSDMKDPMNSEEYIILSYFVDMAFAQALK